MFRAIILSIVSTAAPMTFASQVYRVNCSTPARTVILEWDMDREDVRASLSGERDEDSLEDVQFVLSDEHSSNLSLVVGGKSEEMNCSPPSSDLSYLTYVNDGSGRAREWLNDREIEMYCAHWGPYKAKCPRHKLKCRRSGTCKRDRVIPLDLLGR